MLYQDALTQDDSGRKRTEARLKFLYGDSIQVVKAKASAEHTSRTLEGHTLRPVQVEIFLSDMIYPDWGGKGNRLYDSAQLVAIESNKSSCYLIFLPLN